MERVRLGRSELQVSPIAFGTWSFGGEWGRFDTDEAKATVGRALELGISLFDTAQGYGFGAAERLLGEALWARARREDVIVATKGGLRMEDGRLLRDASGRWLAATALLTGDRAFVAAGDVVDRNGEINGVQSATVFGTP